MAEIIDSNTGTDPEAAILKARQRKAALLSTAESIIAGRTTLEGAKIAGFKPLRFFEESLFSPEELQILVQAELYPADDTFYKDGIKSELEEGDPLAARQENTRALLNKAAIIKRLKSDTSNLES